jgi:hypothetical protein
VLEGTSWIRAVYQARKETRENDRDLVEHVRTSPDLSFKTALFEDSAAMVGLALAAGGLVLRQITGSDFWDGLASVLIGVLLAGLALLWSGLLYGPWHHGSMALHAAVMTLGGTLIGIAHLLNLRHVHDASCAH